jgi:peroxiredoxin Q/BCP
LFFFIQKQVLRVTAEACDHRDNFERFKANNYELLGVSADAQVKQAKFKENIIFRFADEDKSVMKLSAFGDRKIYGKRIRWVHRTTFVIDEMELSK